MTKLCGKATVCVLFLMYAISVIPPTASYVSHHRPNNTYASGYRPANNSYSPNNNNWLASGYKPANNSNQWNNSYNNQNQWTQSGYRPVNNTNSYNQGYPANYKPANNLVPFNNHWNQTGYRSYNNTRYHRSVPVYRPPQYQGHVQNGNNYSHNYYQSNTRPVGIPHNNNPSNYYPTQNVANGQQTKNSTYFQPSMPTNHGSNSHIYPSLPNNGAVRPQQPNYPHTPGNGQTNNLYPKLPNSYPNAPQPPVYHQQQQPQDPITPPNTPVSPNHPNNGAAINQSPQNWHSSGLAALSYSQVPNNQANANIGYKGNQRKY